MNNLYRIREACEVCCIGPRHSSSMAGRSFRKFSARRKIPPSDKQTENNLIITLKGLYVVYSNAALKDVKN